MVPPPRSIVTHAELQRLDLLRHAAEERLAAQALGQPLSQAVVLTLSRIVAATVRNVLATLQREVVAGGEPSHPAGLARREVEVLTLVAVGLRIT
jgi:ATP/maltotriose-dependent transcriptional regulator MalT